MRRRRADDLASLPDELVDPRLWPLCPTDTGGQQPCTCWWAQKQREYLDAGNAWPGPPELALTDLLDMHTRFPCNEPFDGTLI